MTETVDRAARSGRTRERLLDATIESLIEVGYRRSSMREICERAGVSRGAQLHHFPTKAKLMASAIEHLTRKQARQLRHAAADLPAGRARIGAMVDVLATGFSGPLAAAAIELWTASSTDADLRESLLPVERSLGRETLEMFREHAGDDIDPGEFETLFWLSVNLVRGLALEEVLGGNPERRERLLQAWKALAEAGPAGSGPASH